MEPEFSSRNDPCLCPCPATREILCNERLEAIRRLGALARQHVAVHVLMAGDIYDVAAPADRTLRQPIERMRQFQGLPNTSFRAATTRTHYRTSKLRILTTGYNDEMALDGPKSGDFEVLGKPWKRSELIDRV